MSLFLIKKIIDIKYALFIHTNYGYREKVLIMYEEE